MNRDTTCTNWQWIAVLCLLLAGLAGKAAANDMGSVRGRLLLAENTPAEDGVVLFFDTNAGPPPAPGSYWRLPDVGGRIGPDGRFSLQIPAGDYYFGIITVPDGSRQGPPTREDWLYLGRDGEGKLAIYTVAENGRLDLGTMIASYVLAQPVPGDGVVTLEGTITDADNTPVADAVVELYAAEGNNTIPLFQSEKTTADGRYRLLVPPGRYTISPFKVPASRNLADIRPTGKKKAQQGLPARQPQLIDLPPGSTGKTVNVSLPPAR